MTKIRLRKKGEPHTPQEVDPEILAALERVTAEAGQAEATALLERLVEDGDLELEADTDLRALSGPLARQLTRLRDAGTPRPEMGQAVATWLLEQEGVVDLYIDDEELTGRLPAT